MDQALGVKRGPGVRVGERWERVGEGWERVGEGWVGEGWERVGEGWQRVAGYGYEYEDGYTDGCWLPEVYGGGAS